MKKKDLNPARGNYVWLRKLFVIMRLTFFLIFVSAMLVSASGLSQVTQLSLEYKKISVAQLLQQIENQTDYRFAYSNSSLNPDELVSIDVKDGTLDQVLKEILDSDRLSYKIIDRYVVISDSNVSVQNSKQQILTVSGKVTASSGAPVPGVTVVIKGTTNGAITDMDGKYILSKVPSDATLVFSFVGMKTVELAVSGKSVINTIIEEDAIGIEEVVAIGYGTQKKINLTGSVSAISYGENLENRPITHLSQAISGNAAGVLVSQTSGQPGKDGASIRIRGVGTLNSGMNPLVIIDGDVSDLNNVNPNDVASISILKDAASAAIYGSRAANGVVLVTTKKGKSGKTIINYNGSYGVQEATNLFKPVSDYATYMGMMNMVNKADNPGNPDTFSLSTINEWENATDRELYPNTNWMDVIFDQGSIEKHNLSLSGGEGKTTFYMSGSYISNKGILKATDSKKYSFRLNLDHQLNKKIKIGTSLSSDWREINEPIDIVGIFNNSSNSTPGMTPKKIVDGEVMYGGRNTNEEAADVTNPLQLLETSFYPQNGKYYRVKLYGDVDIVEGLKWYVNANIEYFNKQSKQYKLFGPIMNLWNFQTNTLTQDNAGVASTLYQRNDNNLQKAFYSTLNYTKKFNDKHDFNVLLGVSRESIELSYFSASNQGFPSNDTWELDAGTSSPSVAGKTWGSTLESYFGRMNYSFKEKYLFEANLRYDGSSMFAKENRWGLFPSFSGAWRVSEEEFFKGLGLSFIDNIKIRGSWGQLGNQDIDEYQYLNLYSPGQNYTLGGKVVAGLAPTTLANRSVTWETTTNTGIGSDLTLFRNRLNITVDWYTRESKDVLVKLPLPSLYGGLTAPYQNVATVLNKGWEFALSYRDKIGNISYGLGGNISTVDNNVSYFQGDPEVRQSLGNQTYIIQGEPYGVIYGYKAMGTFKSNDEIAAWADQKTSGANKPGDLKYQDISGPDGTPDNVINSYDRTIIGNTIPKLIYGFNAEVGYRGWNLHMLFQGISNVDRYYSNLWYTTAIRSRRQINSYFMDSWSEQNPNSDIPRLTTDSNNDNTQSSSFWVQDASFLRLKDVQLSYNLPAQWLKRSFISKLQIYINGQNLYTWTKFNGLDPETANYKQAYIEHPNVRTISFGINASF